MHGLMGIEPYLIVAAPVRFTFRELNQNPTYAPSVEGRINGDIVKEEVVGFRQQDEHSYNHIVVESHPNLVRPGCAGDNRPASVADFSPYG